MKSVIVIMVSMVAVVAAGPAFGGGHEHRGGVNVRSVSDGPVTRCSDLRFEFDGQPGLQAEETVSIPVHSVEGLSVQAPRNNAASVRGTRAPAWTVHLCKAVSPEASDAERLLTGKRLMVEGGQVSVDEPSVEGNVWASQIIIEAPATGHTSVETRNGPLSVRDTEGKLTLRAQNGPISLRGVVGEVDAHAQNGPISVSGDRGQFRLVAQNGPIEVDLLGSGWTGQLDATTNNGPISLEIPRNYVSGVSVEARGHGPWSCGDPICADARKDWNDEGRRMELGSGEPNVHLVTTNGPVTIREAD